MDFHSPKNGINRYWPIAILETNVGMCQIWVAPSVIPPWWGASNPVLGLLCKALHVALEDLSDDTKWHTTGKGVEKNLGKSWLIHHDTSILRANPDPECLQDAHQILFEIRTESTAAKKWTEEKLKFEFNWTCSFRVRLHIPGHREARLFWCSFVTLQNHCSPGCPTNHIGWTWCL